MGKSIHQETQEILGIIVLLQCEDQVNAVFCILKNKLHGNRTFPLRCIFLKSLKSFVCDTTIATTGEDSDVAERRLGLHAECKWEQVTIFKRFGFSDLLLIFSLALLF